MKSVDVYRCKSCDGIHLVSSEAAEKRCCGENLRSVNEDEVETEVMDPESEKVLKNVFGIGETGLRICFCVIENEGATISEVADEMGLDRSAVSRHMNDLNDAGILEKNTRNMKSGGYVHVYTHADPEKVKRRLTLGSYVWTAKVIELITELNDEKMEVMTDEDADVVEALGGRIWQEQ